MNESRFDAKGKVYADARPRYPEECFLQLKQKQIFSPQSVVADIGSGTGIFTIQLSPFVRTVYAVEPNQNMRLQAEKDFRGFQNICSTNGTAENTTLEASSVDCITVAQAFHWFDRQQFKAECRRILKKGGFVVLIWNDRDAQATVIQENYAINKSFCLDFKGASAGISFDAADFDDFFNTRCQSLIFPNSYVYDEEMFIGRNLSSSYAPKPTDSHYAAYVDALKILFQKYAKDGFVEYPYITRCYIGTV